MQTNIQLAVLMGRTYSFGASPSACRLSVSGSVFSISTALSKTEVVLESSGGVAMVSFELDEKWGIGRLQAR